MDRRKIEKLLDKKTDQLFMSGWDMKKKESVNYERYETWPNHADAASVTCNNTVYSIISRI
jgi:hypothetical protein